MSTNNQQETTMEAETRKPVEKPIETQVAEWSAEKAIRDEQERVSAAERAELARLERERIAAEEAEEAAREAARCALDKREKELLEIPKAITAKIKATKIELAAPLIAAAWARQALATLPAIPTLDMPDDLFIRVERTREDIEDLLNVFAAEMDAEGGAA